MLELEEYARQQSFIVASPTVTANGMLLRIIEKLQDEGNTYIRNNKVQITGATLGAFGFTAGLQFSKDDHDRKSFQYKLDKLCKLFEKQGKGILIMVDEVQANNEELRALIIAYQELIGQNQNLALAMAGLPGAISATLNDKVLTFLNRAKKVELSPLKLEDIDAYYMSAFIPPGRKQKK